MEDKDANDESMAADAGVQLHSLSELREAGGRQVVPRPLNGHG